MFKAIRHSYKKYLRLFSIVLGVLILTPLLAFAAFNFYYSGKVFPGIFVASVNLSGLTQSEASNVLSQNITLPDSIKLTSEGQAFNLDTKNIGLAYNFPDSALRAYNLTRSENLLVDWYRRIGLLFKPGNIEVSADYNEEEIKKFVSVISGQLSVTPVAPAIVINRPTVSINRGSPGKEVNQPLLVNSIRKNLVYANKQSIEVPIDYIDQTLNEEEAQKLKLRAESLIGKSITLRFEYNTYEISDSEIIGFLGPRSGFDDGKIDARIGKIADEINRAPQDPKFVFAEGRVSEFQPALDGIEVKKEVLRMDIIDSISKLETIPDKNISIDIPTAATSPKISTEKVNNLGIKELIGRGTSTYFNSAASRVHNISVSSQRINGTLVAPGETFSFNDTLGDVSTFTGYQQAYVILDGKTVLGDGGGVCQVSTTLFRSLLNAGLPITERQAHAYRVSYYEQGSSPGLDATVYSPSPDLKFVNNTPGHILIQAKADTKNYSLVFELYGTSDGRVATISKPVTTKVTAPPEDLYKDDPTLPSGTVKQIERRIPGARVTFEYKVTRNGEELINKTFVSNYRPWQAVYLRGTGPAI